MSGIAALWQRDGQPVEAATLDRMVERLAARGPDGAGVWRDGPVGLGHRMLHATPESLHEKMPLASEAGDLVVTADLRLDNREDLLAALAPPGRAPETVGDAELVLRAWARWGEACPARLLGDFAFALWDARHRVLFCARDPAGVKPLYHHTGPRQVVVASEVKAVLAHPDVPRALDEVELLGYLVPGLADRTATSYAAVRQVPPGHQLAVDASGPRLQAYWTLDPDRELRLGSDAAYAEAFRALFDDAVRRRRRSIGPVGFALSGGLDSSAVVCTARALLTPPDTEVPRTYSAVFPTVPGCDERGYIGAVVAGGGLAPRYVRGDTLDPLAALERDPWYADETLGAPSYYMHRALYQAARRDGVRVFVEGTGGDLVVSHGAGRLADLVRRGRWLAFWRQARDVGGAFGAPPWRVAGRAILAAGPAALRRARERVRHHGRLWDPLVRPDVARRLDLEGRLRDRDRARPARPGADAVRAEQWRQLTSALPPAILQALEGPAGAEGVETRDPFFDRRLVEFCLALPAEQKIRGGLTRIVMRHALADVLPPEVRDRPGKAPLALMLPGALAAFGRPRLDAVMEEAGRTLAPWLDAGEIGRRYRRHLEDPTTRDAMTVWRLATLALWLRRASPA